MNVWTFSGNLGKDSEVKQLPSGASVCEFSVAVSTGYGDNKKTTWANCSLFGKRAEGGLPGYLVKGQSVIVSGEAVLETWESNGVKGSRLKCNVNDVDLNGRPEQSAPMPQAAPAQPAEDFSEDIPF